MKTLTNTVAGMWVGSFRIWFEMGVGASSRLLLLASNSVLIGWRVRPAYYNFIYTFHFLICIITG